MPSQRIEFAGSQNSQLAGRLDTPETAQDRADTLQSFLGVDYQQAAIGHIERALDLARKIGVPGCIDEVYAVVAVLHSRDLGSDGNATLALLVATVHYEVLAHFCLVVAKGVALLEQTID